MRSKNVYIGISMELLLEIIDDFIDGDANEATEEYDCTDMTQGVFKSYAFFLFIKEVVTYMLCYFSTRCSNNQPACRVSG